MTINPLLQFLTTRSISPTLSTQSAILAFKIAQKLRRDDEDREGCSDYQFTH